MRLGRERAGKAPVFSEGNPSSIEIRQKNILRAIQLRVKGNIVVTGGTGAGSIHADAPYRVARIISSSWDGEERQSVFGTDLKTFHNLFNPKERTQTFPTTLTAGTKAFDVIYTLPFGMPHCKDEQSRRFALPTKVVDAPMLGVQWGNVGDLTYGATDYTSIAYSGVTVEVYEITMHGVAPAVRGYYLPLMLKTSFQRIVEDVTGEVHELPGWVGGQEIRAVIATALEHGAGDTDYRASSTLLTKLGLGVNGVEEMEPVATAIIQGDNEQDYNLSTIPTGVAVLDSATDRDVSPGQIHVLQRGMKPYVKFDADHNSGNGQQMIRFLTIGTEGRFPKAA